MKIWKKNNKPTIENIGEVKEDKSKEILEEVSTELETPIEKKSHDTEEISESTTSEAKDKIEESIKDACSTIKLNAEDSAPSKTPKFDAWYAKRYIQPKKELREVYEKLAAVLGEEGVIEFIRKALYNLYKYDIYGSIDAYRLFVMPMYNIAQPYRDALATVCKMCFLWSVNSWTTHIKGSIYDIISYNKPIEDYVFDMFSYDYPDTYRGYMMGDSVGSNPGQSLDEIRSRKIYHIEYNFAIDHVYLLSPALTFNPKGNGAVYDTNIKITGNDYEEIVLNFHSIETTKSKVSHRPNVEDNTVIRTVISR